MHTTLNYIKRYWKVLTLSVFMGISVLSLWPLESLPSVPGSDKTHHFIAYAALMFPVALRRPKFWKWIGLFFVFYSGLIELIQPFVNRYGEWFDLLANVIGLCCGVFIATLLNFFTPKAKSK